MSLPGIFGPDAKQQPGYILVIQTGWGGGKAWGKTDGNLMAISCNM